MCLVYNYVPVGIIINSGLKIKILREFLVSPIVDISAMMRGGRVIDKNSVVFSLTVNPTVSVGVNAIKLITIPLAINVKRQAANAVRNLPPRSPSRGPDGLMIRQTPTKRNLKKKEK